MSCIRCIQECNNNMCRENTN